MILILIIFDALKCFDATNIILLVLNNKILTLLYEYLVQRNHLGIFLIILLVQINYLGTSLIINMV